MSRRFVSINLAKPMETVRQNPFVLCAWPSFAESDRVTNAGHCPQEFGRIIKTAAHVESPFFLI
jgi:hypothetical protein